jgi:hypothetical protein
MPDLSLIAQPLWTAAALLAVLLVILTVAMRRSGSPGSTAALFGVPALVVMAWSAWNFAEHSILRQAGMEREALDARGLQLTAAAIAPGSPLACLDSGAGDAVEASCEAAIFLKPETVAAATAYVEARLRLLADGFDYAHRADTAYYNALTQSRQTLEADRYGFVAHVLMSRDGCTADSCVAFGWLLHDTGPVKANMASRKLEATIARYAVTWNGGSMGAATGSVATLPAAPPLATTFAPISVTRPIDFPSAASIPAVSIMTDQPNAAGSAAAAAPPPPVRRPPAAASGTARTAPPSAPIPLRPQ